MPKIMPPELLSYKTLRQMIVFVLVGGASAVVDISVIWAMLKLGLGDFLAVTLGFGAGLAVNYMLHLRVTFASTFTGRSVVRFLIVTALNYGLTLAIIFLARELFSTPTLIGKVISLPVIALNGYFLARYWIFKTNTDAESGT